MANTVVRGDHTIGNFPANTGLDSVDGRIIRLSGIAAPTMNMIGVDREVAMEETNDLFRWRTEDEQPNYLTVNGALISTATTLVVDEIDLAQDGQYGVTENGEIIRMHTFVSGTNTATIVRGGSLGSTAAAIADNSKIRLLPAALTPREQPNSTPTVYGEFRQNNFAQLGWTMNQDYWSSAKPTYMVDPASPPGGRTRLEEAKQKFLTGGPLARQMELAAWYGAATAMTESTRGYFDGIKEFVTVNLTTSAGDLTFNMVMDHIHAINQSTGVVAGSDGIRRFRLYGNAFMLGIFNALASTYSTAYRDQSAQISPTLRVKQFETDFGILEFMVIDQLLNGELYGVDFSDISWKPMAVRLGPNAGLFLETKLNHENTAILEEDWFYWFRGSLKLGHPALHFAITGITMDTGAYTGYMGPTPS